MGRFNNAHAAALAPVIERSRGSDGRLGVCARFKSCSRAGFAPLCLFTISAYANEFATHNPRQGLRLHDVVGFASVAFDRERKLLRPFRDRIAWLWTLFLVWMLVATPFSVWRGRIDCAFAGLCPARLDSSFAISPPSPFR
jgi:hypothetical protein